MFIVNIFQQDLKCWQNLAPNILFKDIKICRTVYKICTWLEYETNFYEVCWRQQELSIPSTVSQYIPWREAESSLSGNGIVRR